MAKQKFSPREAGKMLDTVHLIVGAAVILLAVFAIADPEKNKVLFPLVFLLASFINAVNCVMQFKMFPRNRKKHISGWIYGFTGTLMLGLFVLSAVSIWGNH